MQVDVDLFDLNKQQIWQMAHNTEKNEKIQIET